MRKLLCRASAIVIGMTSVGLIVFRQSMTVVVICMVMWFGAGALWLKSLSKPYNETVGLQKCINGLQVMPIGELCQALQSVDTPFGKPWLCLVHSCRKPAVVYGPDNTGSFIYGYYTGRQFYLAGSSNMAWLHPKATDAARLAGIKPRQQIVSYQDVYLAGLLTAYQKLFAAYALNGVVPDRMMAARIFATVGQTAGKLYLFAEDISLPGQRFVMKDMRGQILYDIEGIWPFRTMRIIEHGTDKTLLRVTKRSLHFLPHYDVYAEEDAFIGQLHRRLNFMREEFEMDMSGEVLSMYSIAAEFGANYVIRLNGRQIGSISQDLSLQMNSFLFDNIVIEVFDDNYTLLLAALGLMRAGKLAPDVRKDCTADDNVC